MIAQHPAEQTAGCFIENTSATLGEPLVLLFVACAAFGDPLVLLAVARAAFGQALLACLVAGARNLKPLMPERMAKRSIVTLESNVMLVFRGRRKTKVEIVTMDALKKEETFYFLRISHVMILTFS